MRTLCLALLPLSAFAAGPLIVGGRGGVPFNTNDTVANALGSSLSSSQPFVIGPTAGVRLPLGFSVEGDALYRRQNFGIGQFGGFTAASTTASSWEFPVMLRFSPGHGPIAPVFGAGVTVRHLNQFSAVPGFLFE